MTINVALVTSEAIVLGCDSTASTTTHLLNAFAFLELDGDGGLVFDDEHRLTAKFNVGDLQPVVTNAWGGVTKLFPVSKDPAPVVAVTAGAAKLNDRSMASLGSQFSDILQSRKQKLISVGPIARAFLKFLRKVYEQHYANSTLPEQFRDGPEFLVGGFGKQASFPELYRVKVRENTALPEFKVGETGVCWNGQSDAVERLLNGFDSSLVASIGTHISQLMQGLCCKVRLVGDLSA